MEVYTAAGLRIRVTRGCSEDTCSPSNDCKLKSRIGKCKSCCQGNFCNYELPDVDAAVTELPDIDAAVTELPDIDAAVTELPYIDAAVTGQCYNRYVITVLSVLSMLLIFYIR